MKWEESHSGQGKPRAPGRGSGCSGSAGSQWGDQGADRRAKASGGERNQKHAPGEFGFIREASRGFLKVEKICMCPWCFKNINLPMVYKKRMGLVRSEEERSNFFQAPEKWEMRVNERKIPKEGWTGFSKGARRRRVQNAHSPRFLQEAIDRCSHLHLCHADTRRVCSYKTKFPP